MVYTCQSPFPSSSRLPLPFGCSYRIFNEVVLSVEFVPSSRMSHLKQLGIEQKPHSEHESSPSSFAVQAAVRMNYFISLLCLFFKLARNDG